MKMNNNTRAIAIMVALGAFSAFIGNEPRAVAAEGGRGQTDDKADAPLQTGGIEGNKTAKGNYATVNGLKMYYEIHGAGKPLILLHGGLGAIEMFGPNLPVLAKRRQVIAVDLQGHGRTADIDRPIRLELMADDIAALIKHLGLERADVMGYSMGGGVALRTAIQHPELVRKLVAISIPFKRSGWYPENLANM